MQPSHAFMLLGTTLGLILFLAGFYMAVNMQDRECFEGIVGINRHFDTPGGGADQVVVGDAIFCGKFSNTRGPSELYHEPHVSPEGTSGT